MAVWLFLIFFTYTELALWWTELFVDHKTTTLREMKNPIGGSEAHRLLGSSWYLCSNDGVIFSSTLCSRAHRYLLYLSP